MLIDSWEFIYGAFEYTLIFHNHPLPVQEIIDEAMGKPLLDFYKVIFPNQDVQIFAKTHQDFQADKFNLTKPFPNVIKTLKILKDKKILIAVISNRTRDSLFSSLKQTKILKLIDVVVSADDVKNPKPHQEHILVALDKLKVKPAKAYMVGDTDSDILAGKNAKVKTIGVTYGFSGENVKDTKPDFVIDKIEELLSIIK